ncbi:hypothetical protein AOC05_18010 [Arthrobacter alpinus]|uniref:Uncharacterized protein n=2 Tax=Arthrobacter alpinus TaxID=656366 RepID=A0A0M4RRC5_9MICC|nr:hypothetical protein AOC05_18010 [Arthrobacter alpinus]
MTTSPQALASIVTSGRVEARNRFGIGRGLDMVAEKHEAACFTEMPLSELDRLRDRGKSWGIAFKRDFVLQHGGQRVWYLDINGSPYQALHGLKEVAFDHRDWTNPVWDITPFVDQRNPGSYAFEWEREWRVVGGLRFDLEDVVLLIGLDGVEPLLHEKFSVGAPYYDAHDMTYQWDGGTIPEVGANMETTLDEFHSTYLTPDNAGIPYESEDGYMWLGCAISIETEDALEDLLPEAPWEVKAALADHLNQISVEWALPEEVDPRDDETTNKNEDTPVN